MREVTEGEAFELVGEAECPVLRKEESDPIEAAVCLKKFPTVFLLGASDKLRDLRLWVFDDLATAEVEYEALVGRMRQYGTPFGGASENPDAEPQSGL